MRKLAPNEGVTGSPILHPQAKFTRKNLLEKRAEAPEPKASRLNAGLSGTLACARIPLKGARLSTRVGAAGRLRNFASAQPWLE